MKPAISLGLMLLLASCATPNQTSSGRPRTAAHRSNDTLRPRLVALRGTPDRSIRRWRPGDDLPGEFRTYGTVEEPAPIAAMERPRSVYRAPMPPRRIIEQVSNQQAQGTEQALPPSADVTPSGSYRSVINQITIQPLEDGENTRAPHGPNQTVINQVSNAPVPTSPAPIVAPRTQAQRTVIDPIANSPVQ